AGGRACQHRPARSLHPGRGGRTRLPPRGPLIGPLQADCVGASGPSLRCFDGTRGFVGLPAFIGWGGLWWPWVAVMGWSVVPEQWPVLGVGWSAAGDYASASASRSP